MASLPPSDCCLRGVLHDGTPSGRLETLGSVETYVARTANSSTDDAIVIFSDAFGHSLVNAQLIADSFAKRGYLTVIPDLFGGSPVPTAAFEAGTFDLPQWLTEHPVDKVHPICARVIAELKASWGVKRLAGVGYCFGGRHVVRNLQSGMLDAGFIAHPSFVTIDEIKAIAKPLSIAAAESDAVFTNELRSKSEQILAALAIPYQINLYGGVEHGFAVRGDLTDKRVRFANEQAFEQAVTWFQTWL